MIQWGYGGINKPTELALLDMGSGFSHTNMPS